MIRAFLMALGLSLLVACWPVEEMKADRFQRKVLAYEAANPGKPIDQATYLALKTEADKEVEAEIAAEKAKAIKQAAGAAVQVGTGAATSNPVAVGTGVSLLVGAILMYFGVSRNKNGAIPKKEG